MDPHQQHQNQSSYPVDLANDPNMSQAQLLEHLRLSHEAFQQLQHQVNSLLQQQAQAPNLQTTLEAFATNQQELQRIFEANQTATNQVLDRLARRQEHAPRPSIPVPLSPKFKADDQEMSFAEFQAKLSTASSRFPESLATDKDMINYAILSMEGPPSRYLAPFINGLAEDDDGILLSYKTFMSTLEAIYGDQTQTEEVNYKLQRLRQTGSMIDYIASFRSLSSRVQWNEPALVARFKDGLSDEVKLFLAPQWHTLKKIKITQEAATTAYLNHQSQARLRGRLHRAPIIQSRKPQVLHQSPAPTGPAPMDLDAVRVRRLTPEEKQRRRDQGLCLYCGGSNHFAQACPLKKNPQVAIVAIDSENESA